MQRFWAIVKARPWLIGLAVLAVVVLIWLMSRGKGSSEPSGTVVVQGSAQAQDHTTEQINAGVKLAEIQKEIKLAEILGQQAIVKDTTTADVRVQELANEGALELARVNTAAEVSKTQMAYAGLKDVETIKAGSAKALADVQYLIEQGKRSVEWRSQDVAYLLGTADISRQILSDDQQYRIQSKQLDVDYTKAVYEGQNTSKALDVEYSKNVMDSENFKFGKIVDFGQSLVEQYNETVRAMPADYYVNVYNPFRGSSGELDFSNPTSYVQFIRGQ